MRDRKKMIEIDTFCGYHFVNNPVSSSDGRWTAFTEYTVDREGNAYKGTLQLLDHVTMKWAPICPEQDIRCYEWLPQGSLLIFTGGKAWELNPDTRQLTERFPFPFTPDRLVICGDGRALFLGKDQAAGRVSGPEAPGCNSGSASSGYTFGSGSSVSGPPAPDVTLIDEIPYWENGTSYLNGAYRRLFLLDLTDGTWTGISDPTVNVTSFTCLEGRPIYAGTTNPFEEPRPGIYRQDPDTGAVETLVSEGRFYIHFLEALGSRLIFSGTTGAQYGKNQYGGIYEVFPSPTLLCAYEASLGENEIIGDCGHGAGRKHLVTEEGLYFTSVVRTHSELCLMKPDGTISTQISAQSSIDGFSIAGSHLVLGMLPQERPQELYLSARQGDGWGIPAMLTNLNASIADYALAQVHPMGFTASDGRDIDGWMMVPPDMEEGRSCPGILCIHGGPRMIYSTMFYHEMQVLAAAGYAVFFCNPVGSSGRGNDFGYLKGKAGDADYRELMEFTDHCLAQCPFIDPDRLSVMGGSYGGYMVNWIIGHTDRFKAAVSQRSISNWLTTEAGSDIGYYYVNEQLGAGFLDDPDLLWDRSPIKYAGQVSTPTLFMHSDKDFRCWIAEPMQMFYALKKRGIPTRLAVFHGESHTLAKLGRPQHRIARLEYILSWLKSYCPVNIH